MVYLPGHMHCVKIRMKNQHIGSLASRLDSLKSGKRNSDPIIYFLSCTILPKQIEYWLVECIILFRKNCRAYHVVVLCPTDHNEFPYPTSTTERMITMIPASMVRNVTALTPFHSFSVIPHMLETRMMKAMCSIQELAPLPRRLSPMP